jgi:hypothetical protein
MSTGDAKTDVGHGHEMATHALLSLELTLRDPASDSPGGHVREAPSLLDSDPDVRSVSLSEFRVRVRP